MNADPQPAVPARGSQGMVLVIDDEPGVRRFAVHVLESAGYQVVEAGDGQQGLNLFAQQKRDVVAIIMDLSMPGMDGPELARESRRLDPDIPILVMSGYSDTEVAQKLDGTGVSDFVRKPFVRWTSLRAWVRRCHGKLQTAPTSGYDQRARVACLR